MKKKIYISSTYKDLVKHRETVASILCKMRRVVDSMEDYTATQSPTMRTLGDLLRNDLPLAAIAMFTLHGASLGSREGPMRAAGPG